MAVGRCSEGVDAFTLGHLSAVGRRLPDALTVRVLEAAVRLRGTVAAVPTVDAHLGRAVADVEPQATVSVRLTRFAEADGVRQAFPRKPAVSK